MLVKTRGVVLKFIKYKETSIIVNIYTERHGLQSYLINSVRSVRAKKNRIALYQPLTLLEVVVYYREGRQLQRLSEARCSQPFYTINSSAKKAAISLFIVEILSKTLKEQSENVDLFNFIWSSIQVLDSTDITAENFHLIFMLRLSKYLGFSPGSSQDIWEELKNEIDLKWIQSAEAQLLNQLLACDYRNTPALTNEKRAGILQILLSFYRFNVEQFGTVKSVKILNQVFS